MGEDGLVIPSFEECRLKVTPAEGGGYQTAITLAGGGTYSEPTAISLEDVQLGLTELLQEPQNYGQLLFNTFFAGQTGQGLAVARGRDGGRGLRIELELPPTARLLHTLRWEWLYDPASQTALGASPDFALSRFMSTTHAPGQPVSTRPLRILVVVSNPDNLRELGLEPLLPDVERQKIEEALVKVSGQVEYKFMPGRATLDNIRNSLEAGQYHVIHVAAHGYFKDKGYLVLEDDNGRAVKVDEGNFGDVLLGQPQVRLVVLAACLSSSLSPARAFAGLAPALVVRGVPAVVAMQGRIEEAAAQIFIEHFYRHLGRFGVVDAAVNYARYRLYLDTEHRPLGQWGLPVLFMHTDHGELYHPAPVELGAGLPEQLKSRFLPLLREFVDREDQSLLFRRMMSVEKVERILFAQGIAGMGKTWFIGRCIVWCSENGVTCRELDFSMNPGKPWDYLVVLDQLIGDNEAPFAAYRTLASQKTAGGRERAFEPESQRVLTECYIRCLASQPATGRVAVFLDHLNMGPQDVRDWLWKVFLPLFQARRYPLDHVTIVVTGREEEPGIGDAAWLHVLERTELKPLTLEYFLEFAAKRNLPGWSEEALAGVFEGWAVAAEENNRSADEEFTPYRLSLRLTALERRARQGGGVR